MPAFSYKATDLSGNVVKGIINSIDEDGVVQKLHEMSYIPIRIDYVGKSKENLNLKVFQSNYLSRFSLFKGISGKDVMMFTQDLSTLLSSGLPIDKALSILISVSASKKFKLVIEDIYKSVQGGMYLSDAMAKHSDIFSRFYVNMLRAGESGGVLEKVLERLGTFLEDSQDLKDYVKSALVYPIFLVLVGGISIIILMTFVVPKFAVIFSDLGQTMPSSTRFLLDISHILRMYWWLILIVFISIYLVFWRYKLTPSGRIKVDKYKINLPIMGAFIRNVELARFVRMLGTLIKSGVPILEALSLVKDTISNTIIASSIENVQKRVKEGERLSKPLEDIKIFPSLAIQMITVGEETGRLDELLLKVAENYEKLIKNFLKRIISFLEPAMILGMGLVVGFIVISMLMAIFSMNDISF